MSADSRIVRFRQSLRSEKKTCLCARGLVLATNILSNFCEIRSRKYLYEIIEQARFLWKAPRWKSLVEICDLLGYYTVSSGDPLPTFRDNVSVPHSRVKKSKKQKSNAASNGNPLPTFRDKVSIQHSRVKKSKKQKSNAASNGNPLPTFRDNVSIPHSRVKKSKKQKANAASNVNPLPTFRDKASIPHSRVKNSKKQKANAASNGNPLPTFRDNVSIQSWTLKTGPLHCPETSVNNYN
jgi:hypothetical protein